MFRPIKDVQNEAEFVFIEDLVPQNHLLRKVDKYVDFSASQIQKNCIGLRL